MNVIQTVTNTSAGSNASSVSVTVPNVGADSSLVVFTGVAWGNSSYGLNLSDNLGTTYTKHREARDGSSATFAVFSAKPQAGSVTLTATYGLSISQMQITVVEVSGLGELDAVNGYTANYTSTPTITTTEAGIVFAAFFVGESSSNTPHTFTLSPGYTLAGQTSDTKANTSVQYKIETAAGSHNAVVSMSGSTTFAKVVNHIIAFKAGINEVLSEPISLSSIGTTSVTPRKIQKDNPSLSGVGIVSATPLLIEKSSVTLSGTGSVTVHAGEITKDSASLSATGNLTITPIKVQKSSVSLTGAGTVTANPMVGASLTGIGTVVVTGIRIQKGGISSSSSGTVSGTAGKIQKDSISLSTSGTVSGTARRIQKSSVPLTVTGNLAVVGIRRTPNSAALNGSASITVSVKRIIGATIAMVGRGTIIDESKPLVLAVGSVTIVDLMDAVIAGDEPPYPTLDQLWIKRIDGAPDELYRWDGVKWELQTLSLETLDPDAHETIEEVASKLEDLASDSIITVSERIPINEKVTEIIGELLTDATDMPTITDIDVNIRKGEMFSVRQQAIKAGVLNTHTDYAAVETAYNNLRTYLNGMSPRPWNVTLDANITVDPSTWRTKWLGYQNAVSKLNETVAERLKSGVDLANSRIDDIASDSKLTPTEKTDAKMEWDIISAEKPTLESQASIYGITAEKDNFINSFNSLSTYITPLLADLTITSDIDGPTFRNKFKDYYDKKALLLKKISDFAYDKFADFASDSKLDASEKLAVKKEWDVIEAEKPILDLQGALYSITQQRTEYTTAYDNLKTYLTPLLTVLTVTSNIDGAVFRSKFVDYYVKKANLLSAITESTKTRFDDIADDNKLNPVEKSAISKEWGSIALEYPSIAEKANTYGADEDTKTRYINAYEELRVYLEPLLLDMDQISDIAGTDFRNKFLAYYQRKTDVLHAIWDRMFSVAIEEVNQRVTLSTYENDITNPTTGLLTRMDTVESKVEPTAIVDTVRKSDEYANDLNNILSKISELQQTTTETTEDIQNASGVNILQNSIGYAGLNKWQVYSTNEVTNSALQNGTSGFTLDTGWSVDSSFKYDGYNTFKCIQTGLASNSWKAVFSNFVPTAEGEKRTGSWWVYVPSNHGLDQGAGMEVEWYNDTTRISTSSVSIDVSKVDTWQRISVQGTAPAGTTKSRIRIHPMRNGKLWVALPQFEKENLTPWAPALADSLDLVEAVSNNEQVKDKGYGSAFLLKNGGKLIQTVAVEAEKVFTLSSLIQKLPNTKGYIRIYDGAPTSSAFKEIAFDDDDELDFQNINTNVIPKGTQLTVELGGTFGSIVKTANMLNIGKVPLQWQQAAGEVYSPGILFDDTGMKIISQIFDGYFNFSPEEFASYAKVKGVMEKVFALNNDITEMRAANIGKEMVMGSGKLVPVSSSSNRGMAYVAAPNATSLDPIDNVPPVVTASVAGGTYSSSRTVTLSVNKQADIFYTLDGSDPTVRSPIYSSALTIDSKKILKYFAKGTNKYSSPIQTQVYSIVPISDSFNRSNSSSSLGSTSVGSKTWQKYSGSNGWGISGNLAYPVSPIKNSPVYIDAGYSDDVAFSIRIATYQPTIQIFWRISNSTNYFCLLGPNIYKYVNGTPTLLDSIPEPVSGDTIRIELNGNLHNIFKNNIWMETINDSSFQTATRFGFTADSTIPRFDDVQIELL